MVRDGWDMVIREPNLVRKVIKFGLVVTGSTCSLVMIGCQRVADRLDGGK